MRVNRLFLFFLHGIRGLQKMHRKSAVGGGIALVTIQTDTSKPRQVVAAADSRQRRQEAEGGRERGMHRGRKRVRRRDDYERIRGM